MICNYLIRRGIAKYEAVYFVGDNQAIHRVRVDSYKTRHRGAFSRSLAALIVMYKTLCFLCTLYFMCFILTHLEGIVVDWLG